MIYVPVIPLGRLWFFGHIERDKICENTMSPVLLGAGAGSCGHFLCVSGPIENNSNIIHMHTLTQLVTFKLRIFNTYVRTYIRMLKLIYKLRHTIFIHTVRMCNTI